MGATIGFIGIQLFCIEGDIRRVLIPDALFGVVYEGEAVDPHIPALLVATADIAYDGWGDGDEEDEMMVYPLSGEWITIESSDQSRLDTTDHDLPRVRDYCPGFTLGDRFPIAATVDIVSGTLSAFSLGGDTPTVSVLDLATNGQVTLVANGQFRLTLVPGATAIFLNLSDKSSSRNDKRNHFSIYYAMGKQKKRCSPANHPQPPAAAEGSDRAVSAVVPALSMFEQYIRGAHADCSNSTYP